MGTLRYETTLLKEEMLSVISSSNYKSECLELNTFNYYPDINSPIVDIPENFKSLYLKNIGGLNEFIRSRTFPYIKTLGLTLHTYLSKPVIVADILKSFPSLESLIITDATYISFKNVDHLSSLADLRIENNNPFETLIEDIHFRSVNENLRSLYLYKVKAKEGRFLITCSQNLETVCLVISDINDYNFDLEDISFKDLPKLSKLVIRSCNLERFKFDELPDSIESLELSNSNLFGEISVKDLSNLDSLDIRGNWVSSIELVRLPAFRCLIAWGNSPTKLTLQDCFKIINLGIPSTTRIFNPDYQNKNTLEGWWSPDEYDEEFIFPTRSKFYDEMDEDE